MKRCCIILITVIFLWSSPTQSGEETKAEMPDQFNDIYIGMPLEDFMKARPDAEIDIFSDEKPAMKKPNLIRWEHSIDHPVFTNVMYFFSDNSLKTVTFLTSIKRGEALIMRWEVFLREAITKWGRPDSISIIEDYESRHAPLLFWKRDSLMISAMFVAEKQKQGQIPLPSIIGVTIKAADKTPFEESYRIVEVDEAEREKIISPVEATIERLIKDFPPTTRVSSEQD